VSLEPLPTACPVAPASLLSGHSHPGILNLIYVGLYLAQEPTERVAAPAIARMLQAVGQRFGVQISEKVAAQAVPAIGAVGGATINFLFMKHFQDMAHGHFTVRRLENKYGEELVKQEYRRCLKESTDAPSL
jgi:hypothetical protein